MPKKVSYLIEPKSAEAVSFFETVKGSLTPIADIKDDNIYWNPKTAHWSTDDLYYYEYENKRFAVKLREKKVGESICFECEIDQDYIEVLIEIEEKILKTSEAYKKYHIEELYSDISSFYAQELYPLFNKFEAGLRELIWMILLKSEIEPSKATKELFDDTKKSKLKFSNGKRRINNWWFVEEMDFSDYIDFFFTPYKDKSIEEYLREIDIEKTSKEKIIYDVLNIEKGKSIWQQIDKPLDFGEFNDEESKIYTNYSELKNFNLQDCISELRVYRNQVMHSRAISKKNYKDAKLLLNKANKSLELATMIDIVNKVRINILPTLIMLDSLSKLAKSPLVRFLNELGKKVDENIKPKIKPNAIQIQLNELAKKINENSTIFKTQIHFGQLDDIKK